MTSRFRVSRLAILGLSLLAAACSELSPMSPDRDDPNAPKAQAGTAGGAPVPLTGGLAQTGAQTGAPVQLGPAGRRSIGSAIYPGQGPASVPRGPGGAFTVPGGEVNLSFSGVEIVEVTRAVLGDLLELTYAVDPSVSGTITLETMRPIPRADVLPVFEGALRAQGFAVVRQPSGVYTVVTTASGQRSGLAGAGSAFGTEVIAPRFIGVAALKRLLEPLLPEQQIAQTDPSRNLLMVTGTSAERRTVRETVAQFDVDWMRGMSFGLFGLREASARRMVEDLNAMLGGENATIAGLVRLIPIERLNAVLAVSPQPRYLEQIRTWISRLDRESDVTERKVFVYRVQNGRASDVARTLSRAFGLASSEGSGRFGASAAGAGAATAGGFGAGGFGGGMGSSQGSGASGGIGGGASGGVGSSGASGGIPGIGGGSSGGAGRAEEFGGGLGGGLGGGSGGGSSGMLGGASGLNVSADEANNAIVVVGTTRQYELVEGALRRLDTMPVQVVIEAAVAEVTLSDDLRFGLQWAFRSGDFAGILNQTSQNPFGNVTTPGVDGRLSRGLLDLALPLPAVPGFSFIYSAPSVTVVLNALDRITKVNVLSSPHLMVLNNQTAALQVGNQVPITVGTAQSTLVSGGPIVSQLQYKDTGIILQVTPRVNDSGNVLLDIAQEVSAVIDTPSTTTSQIQSPTFLQRRLVSSVSVQDGQTIALGGLIRDSNDNSRGGIPLLSQVPVVGWLFGSTVKATGRTELLVLLTPRVVRGQNDAQLATDELRNRMRLLRPIIVDARGGHAHPPPSR